MLAKPPLSRNAALSLKVCTKPGDLTRESLKSLRLALGREGFTALQLSSAVSQMSNNDIVADIVSLIRRYGINAELLGHEERIRRAVDRLKASHKFTKIESKWIDRMEKYLLNENVLNTVLDILHRDEIVNYLILKVCCDLESKKVYNVLVVLCFLCVKRMLDGV